MARRLALCYSSEDTVAGLSETLAALRKDENLMAKIVGILGGMGPAATVDLFQRIVEATPARRDQDHLHILIDNDPAVPDRTAAILEDGPSPLPVMQAGLARLVRMGAELLAIPCNTAHHYWPALQASVEVPLLNMIQETAAWIREGLPQVERVGILATSGTLAVGLYQRALEAEGLIPLPPTPEELETIMAAIYQVKAGRAGDEPKALLSRAGLALLERGAQALILGCTEIPLVLRDGDLPAPLVASNQVLAQAVVREALAQEPTPG